MPIIFFLAGQIKVIVKGDSVFAWEPLIKKKRHVAARDLDGRPLLIDTKSIVLAIEKSQAEYDAEIEQQKKAQEEQQKMMQAQGQRVVRPNLVIPRNRN